MVLQEVIDCGLAAQCFDGVDRLTHTIIGALLDPVD